MSRLNPVERRLERFRREPPSVKNAAAVIVIATALVVVGAGVAITLLDNKEYPDVGVGMWWALQTVTTVGYGDVAPVHVTGRLLGAVVMLQGTAFIAIVTAVTIAMNAVITSTFVARATRERAHLLLGALIAIVTAVITSTFVARATRERAQEEMSDRAWVAGRLDEIERKLDLLVAARDDHRS